LQALTTRIAIAVGHNCLPHRQRWNIRNTGFGTTTANYSINADNALRVP
jgi:hypothetical protein